MVDTTGSGNFTDTHDQSPDTPGMNRTYVPYVARAFAVWPWCVTLLCDLAV